MNKFSSAFTNYINQSQFSDETIAAMIGVSNTTVRAWKSGAKKPTYEHAGKLGQLLKIEPATIMLWSDIAI